MRVNWAPSDLVASKAEELAGRKSKSQQALQDASEQFEAIFLYQLLEQMRRTVPENDLLGDRRAEKIFQSMLDQELANSFAQTQSVGLAKMIYEQMSRYVPEDD
ncbi:MAG: flagellar biosynthesis protein FlgJ [Firmicutes bacterium]|mgnify:CR=1 FL=1|nr:flagellar biosynthesis protein FlgJ [Bacillota bacterium]